MSEPIPAEELHALRQSIRLLEQRVSRLERQAAETGPAGSQAVDESPSGAFDVSAQGAAAMTSPDAFAAAVPVLG
ncbi:MAG: hypothetical protein R2762_25505, partial [Bryobacteraceae bacterium]